MQTLEQLAGAVEQLKKEVWYIAKVSIPNLGEELGNLSLSDIANMTSTISNNTTRITQHEIQLTNLQNSITSCAQTVTSLQEGQNGLNSWKNSVVSQLSSINQQLSDLISNFGERFEVLYDMDSTDPAVNRGMTTGMVGGNSFEFTKGAYKRLRIFASIYNNDAVGTTYLTTRKHSDLTLMASSILLNKLYYLKVTVVLEGNKLAVNQAGTYDYNTSSNTLTYTRDKGNVNYYIYRVEGFY